MEKSFYQNVFPLTQAVPPSKDFLKYFKEGMFDKPNTIGFLHVSQYLLTIYDEERSKKQLKWPLFSKQEEAKYRTNVKDFLTSVADENPDLDFPQILASHLLHASGSKFYTIMWNLSTVALRTYIKRETEMYLLAPKTGVAEDLSRMLFNNITDQSAQNIQDIDTRMRDAEQDAKTYANETVDSIKKIQEELLRPKQSLIDLAASAPVHPAMKKRLADPNDSEVIEIWKKSIDDSLTYLKTKQKKLKEIADLSNRAADMVASIASIDSNMFDGNRLSNINTNALSEVNGLSPETQIMLQRLDVNGVISLENLLSLVSQYLTDFRRYFEKHGYPDLAVCESQVHASSEDMNSMSNLFRSTYERILSISNDVKSRSNLENYKNVPEDMRYSHVDNDIFDSVILRSSPTININGYHDTERADVHERLELTPVENTHKALFLRHKRMQKDTTPNRMTDLRPNLLVSRINFDDTISSFASERVLSPINRLTSSRLTANQSTLNRSGKYSRLFSTYQKKSVNRFNSTIASVPGSSRNSTIADTSSASDLYNISELRPHLPIVENKLSNNRKFVTPSKHTSTTINEQEDAPASVIDDKTELTIEKVRETERSKDQNRRASISDLVERYKSLREKTIDVTAHFENSSDVSNESENH